jgi:hypothetical protein
MCAGVNSRNPVQSNRAVGIAPAPLPVSLPLCVVAFLLLLIGALVRAARLRLQREQLGGGGALALLLHEREGVLHALHQQPLLAMRHVQRRPDHDQPVAQPCTQPPYSDVKVANRMKRGRGR